MGSGGLLEIQREPYSRSSSEAKLADDLILGVEHVANISWVIFALFESLESFFFEHGRGRNDRKAADWKGNGGNGGFRNI